MKAKRIGLTLLALAAASACSDTTNPLAGRGQPVSLSFAGIVPGISGIQSVNATGDSLVLTSGGNTLVINSVQLVLRKIELKRQNIPVSCDSTSHEGDCEELELGATLVTVPLTAGAQTAVTVPIDSGTYTSAEFKIHKPGGDSVDLAFKAANPTWPSNTSIRVTGTYNGTPFTFTTSLDIEQETAFSPPLVINTSGATTNLTLRADISGWFKTAAGALIDPSTANNGGPNNGVVTSNIEASFKTFRDDNHDGNESNG